MLLYDIIPAVAHTGHIHTALAGEENISCQLDFLARWSGYFPPYVGAPAVKTVHMRPEQLKDALKGAPISDVACLHKVTPKCF